LQLVETVIGEGDLSLPAGGLRVEPDLRRNGACAIANFVKALDGLGRPKRPLLVHDF
jgi:hypothetical protein